MDIAQATHLLAPLVEGGESAVRSAFTERRDDRASAAALACVAAALASPKFADDHYRGAINTLGLRLAAT